MNLNDLTKKYNDLLAEKIDLDVEVSNMKAALEQQKTDLLPGTETNDSKVYMSRVVRKLAFCICENKDADQLRGNAKLISAFVFAT